MSSIKERIDPVRVTLWTEEAVCRGWRFCVACQRDLVAQLDGEGRSRELCVRMRRISRKTSVFNGSVSRGELEDDIELKQKCQCETYK